MKSNSAAAAYVTSGIIVLTIATALIHFLLNFIIGQFDLMFTLNGIGFLALLLALFVNIPLARENRRWIRLGLIGFTAVTILAWILMGDKGWWLGWLTIVIELALIGLLFIKRP